MKMSACTFLCLLLLLALALPVDAAGGMPEPSATIKAVTKLTQWFSELIQPFEEIGATAEKQYLVDGLIDLNKRLFDIQQDKRYLVLALKRRPLVRAELRRSSASLGEKIVYLRQSLEELAPKLRVQYRQGSDEAISLLSEALVERKGFVDQIDGATETSADRQIGEAQAAIEALEQAQRKLADVIVALQTP